MTPSVGRRRDAFAVAARGNPALDGGSLISDLAVALDTDESGRVVVILNYRDRASGRLVDLAYVPFGG